MKHGRDTARCQGVRVVQHRYLVEPLQVLIQASCGIIDISASPAYELDITGSLKYFEQRLQASIITVCV